MYAISAIEHARKKTVNLAIAANLLLVILTLIKGHPTIWSDFDRETNLWTLGNSIQAFLVGVVCYVNYLLLSGSPGVQRTAMRRVWALLALVFVFFAFDDTLLLHERGGHAIEHAAPFLSRASIHIYMDDLIELGYAAGAGLLGVFFLRGEMRGRRSYGYYMLGVALFFVATGIGLNPAVKVMLFPLALIQILQLVALLMFLLSFTNCMTAEIGSICSLEEQERSDKSGQPDGAPQVYDLKVQ